MVALYVRPGDKPRPFRSEGFDYQPGSRCTHNGKVWEAGPAGVRAPALEPGSCDEYHWKEVK